MHCPKCHCKENTKSGFTRGKQRYKCKNCGCNFTQSSLYRTPVEIRAKAIKMYLEGLGFRAIERLEGVSHVSVMKWVRKLGDKINRYKETSHEKVAIMELDELWHFIGKKNKNAGYGLHMIVMENRDLPSGLVVVTERAVASSLSC